MNHGAVTTYTTGPAELNCQKTKGHGDWKKTWVVDGACVEKSKMW